MTPPGDNQLVALTYGFWVGTLEKITREPNTAVEHDLALMCLNLIELNRTDPETGQYLDARGLQAMENTDG